LNTKKVNLFILVSTILILLQQAVSAVELTQEERQYIKNNPQISFTCDPNWLPFEAFTSEGKVIGMLAEHLHIVEADTGLKFSPVPVSTWSESLKTAMDGKVKMISGDAADVILNQKFNPIDTYGFHPIVIIMDHKQNYVEELEDLQEKKIAIIKDYGYTDAVYKRYPYIKFHEVENIQEGLNGVATGKYDAMVATMALGTYTIVQMQLHNLKVVGKTDIVMELTLFIDKNESILYSIINKAIKNIDTKQKQVISEKWVKYEYIEKTDYTITLIISIFSIIIILLLVFWIRSSNRFLKNLKAEKLHKNLALKAGTIGVWEWNYEDDSLKWDDVMYLIYGLDASNPQSPYTMWSTAIDPNDKSRVEESLFKAKDTNGEYNEKFWINTPENEIKYIHAIGRNEFDAHGNATKMVGINIDITEHKSLENELKKAEQKYRNLFEFSEDPMWIIYKDKFILVNQAVVNLFGYKSVEDFTATHPAEISPEFQKDGTPSRDLADEMIAKAFKEGYNRFEWLHKKKNGEELPMEISLTKIPYADSSALFCIGRDITQKIEAEQKEIELLNHFAKIQDITGLGIWYEDIGTNLYHIDKATQDILEVEGAIISTTELANILHPDFVEPFVEVRERLLTVHDITEFDFDIVTPNGTRKNIHSEWNYTFDNEGNFIKQTGYVQDVSERTQYEVELKNAKEKAEHISQFKSEFLANMSHEIRTPMNGILGFVEHLSKGEEDPERLKQFNMIRNSGNTLLHIINDILDFSKIESGKMDLEFHPIHLHKLVSETTRVFQELIGNKHIKFIKNCDDKVPTCIMGDEVRLKQIIFNLLSNAIKFTSENGTISLSTHFNSNKNIIQIAISDTGIGIAEDKLKRIFEAFGQEDASTTRKYGGTGLGLSIASSLIEKMGGEIKVSSTMKKGSTFTILLPLQECSNQDKEHLQQRVFVDQDIVTLTGHILLVEDNKTNQMLLSMILGELGLTYDVANDGVEALQFYNENQYNIILMDENMPNMNGIEATKQIRFMESDKNLESIPIIAVTANALAKDRDKFIKAGMNDYVSKPYTEEDIVGVLKKFL